MHIVSYILDELISAAQRNSDIGPSPEHWYPPRETRERLSLAEHTCVRCKYYDPSHRRITVPFCSGGAPRPAYEVQS